jgi:type I restriction enzyme M protein
VSFSPVLVAPPAPDEKGELAKNFKGYDISPDMVRLSLVNLYLHGFTAPSIAEYDTLTSEDRWNEFADVILANPPFMSPKGGIKPHKRFTIKAKRSEVLFVDYIAEHLTPTGRAGIIVPEGIIFQSQTAYKDLRKALLKDSLVAVISLPAGVFNPYSGVKTSILILDKVLAKKSNTIAFFKVENDGFGLGAQRREIEKNDLPNVLEGFRNYELGITNGEDVLSEEFLASNPSVLVVLKEKIAANGDFNFSGERYREIGVSSSEYSYVELRNICEINPETANPSELYPNSFFNYIDISCVENESGKFFGANKVNVDEAPSRARRLVKQNDVLLSTVRPNLKAFAILLEVPDRAIASTGFAVLRSKAEQLMSGFLIVMLRHQNAVNQMIGMMGKGAYPSINQSDVESIKIPLPPIAIQQEIVAEIEGYQKVIDGAKAVIDNYRPHIPIDPYWPILKLGELFETKSGTTPSRSNSEYFDNGTISWVKTLDLTDGAIIKTQEKITQLALDKTHLSILPIGTVLIAMYGGFNQIGRTGVLEIEATHNQAMTALLPTSKVNPYFLNTILVASKDYWKKVANSTRKDPNITKSDVLQFKLPVPPLETQKAIVAEIEAEQSLVSANRELITRFEKKIQTTLNRIWGEEQKPSLEPDTNLQLTLL